MDLIITDNLRTEQTISSRIDLFFQKHSISRLLKKSNFYKDSGVPCVEIMKTLFSLVFTEKNLYRTLETAPDRVAFRKNTAYRFLNSVSYNWSKFLSLLSAYVVDNLNKATSKDRVNVLIIDDSFYDRNRSKKVELLARVFDHTTHKFVKGFKMLTLGWSDGNTFIPTAFSLLSSAKESNVFQPAQSGIDKRTTAYKRRRSAVSKATEVIFELLDSAKGLPAEYVLFDSWYGLPVTIYGIWKRSYNVICMVKDSSKIHYCLDEKWVDIKKLHRIVSETAEKNGKILGSITVSIRESKDNPDLLPVKLVFVENRQSDGFLTVLSTNIELTDEEILTIYGKRWDIEVFFKMCKSYLSLAKEFQGRSYDMMTAHTTIVFMRYIMLALEARNASDHRTVGGFFYDICDEVKDLRFAEALMLILDLLTRTLAANPVISEEMASMIINTVFTGLPTIWKQKLQLSA